MFAECLNAVECWCLNKGAATINKDKILLSIVQVTATHETVSVRYAHATKETEAQRPG